MTIDVLLEQTNDNGDITVEGGAVTMTSGLDTAAYLSMFGGREWWGNLSETEPARQYNSETEAILDTLPATSGNLKRLEDAVARDLKWLKDEGIASAVKVNASILALNSVLIEVTIKAEGSEQQFAYTENWRASI